MAMQYIELLVMLSMLLTVCSADVTSKSSNFMGGKGVKAKDPGEAVSWEHGSVLGLQRSVQLSRGRALPVEEEEVNAASNALRHADKAAKDGKTSMQESLVSQPVITLAEGSLLGLQRSAKVIRRSALPSEDEATTPQSTRLKKGAPSKGKSAPPDTNSRQASVLGFQRSMTLNRKQAPPQEEEREVSTSKGSSTAFPLELDDDTAALRLEDVSVLGLQRSAKVVKRSKIVSEAAPVNTFEV